MEIFNLIAGVCSIVGLFVSLFVASNVMKLPNSNTLCFNVDFTNTSSKPEQNRWIGYSIKSLPMRDWRSFVNENYYLQLNYMATETIGEIHIELTNKHSNQKIYQSAVKLKDKSQKFVLRLNDYKDTIIDWKFVDEICFVFLPENCIGQKGSVFISDLSINKN